MLLKSENLIFLFCVIIHYSVLTILISASEIKQTPLDSDERNFINILGTFPADADSNMNNIRTEQENATNIDTEKLKMSLDDIPTNSFYEPSEMRTRNQLEYIENESDIPKQYDNLLKANDDLLFGDKYGLSRSVLISAKSNNIDALKEIQDNIPNYIGHVSLFDLYKRKFCSKLVTWPKFLRCMEQLQFPYPLSRIIAEGQGRNTEDESKNNVENRNIYYTLEGKRNGPNIPKRIPFHAWGGKRVLQTGNEKIQASRVPFNAWGGKRQYNDNKNYNSDEQTYEPCKRSKVKFHSWGGKRNERK